MKISPITNNNTNLSKPNFGTKLPRYNCKYTGDWSDYWVSFANACINEGKEAKLKELLKKLANNFDENILSLVFQKKKLDFPDAKTVVNTSIVFMLHNHKVHPLAPVDVSNSLNSQVKLVEKATRHSRDLWSYSRKLDIEGDVGTDISRTDILLDILEKIVTPKTDFHKRIFGNTAESILEEFRYK